MDFLQPTYFFDYSNFEHKDIFEDFPLVWMVLLKIEPYLESLSLGSIETEIPEGVHLINKSQISIGKGTVVEPGAYIKGPCVIGEHCTVRQGAYLRGCVIAGNHCVLGHDSEFKNALLLDHAQAAHFAYVGDTILGNRVNLGAGTICANLKLDKGSIVLHVNGERVDTGMRKFGAILGDDAQTGCNSVTNPGTLLGKGAKCYPCTNFGGFIAAGKTVRMDTKIQVS